MSLNEFFPEEEIEKAKRIIKEFHGRMLITSSINNPSLVILSTYMSSNKKREGLIDKDEVKNLFISFGKKSEEFDKALYELSGKRKGKIKLIDTHGNKIGLNFNGVDRIKDILREKKNG